MLPWTKYSARRKPQRLFRADRAAFAAFLSAFTLLVWVEMEYRLARKSYRLPMRHALRTAHGSWSKREGILVRLESPSGVTGFGEAAPIPWFGTETLAEADARLAGLGDRPAADLLQAVPARFGCVRFALACALAPVTMPPGRRPVTALLPAGRAAIEMLPDRLADGFLSFKWKVGVEAPADEMAMLDDLLAALPAYARLRVDANGAWDRRTAARWLDRGAGRPVEFFEQPLSPEDVDGLLGLAADYPVTLALDESVATLAAAREWQERGWRGIFVIKPALAGPPDEITEWVARSGADVVISSSIETAVGRTALVRLACDEKVTRRAAGLGVGPIFVDEGWNGPAMAPLLDATWINAVSPEALWNALS
ncbi:MAG TPA: o-succinylbenzoate synthase [Candidatus Didemnitutus sp.]|jgi:O-succinylbenzoate synthase